MQPVSWMLKTLEYATRGHHIAADAWRVSLLGMNASRERYVDYLLRTYAFEAPVEARWRETPDLERVLDVQRCVRTGFLVSDLRVLGAPIETPQAASFTGLADGLGWMFVVERGRRLNGMLLRHLLRRIPHVMVIAGNYLAASSPIGTRWQQLGATLDQVASDRLIAERIIEAAQNAFSSWRTTAPAPAPTPPVNDAHVA